MKEYSVLTPRWIALTVIAMIITAACIAVSSFAAAPLPDVVLALDEAKFEPITSTGKEPGEAKLAFSPLWEDPASGRRSYLLKWTKGSVKRHTHPFNYQLVVLKGTMTHWTEGMPDAVNKKLGVGGYYYQPVDVLHAESCLSEECITLSTILEYPGGKPPQQQ